MYMRYDQMYLNIGIQAHSSDLSSEIVYGHWL